MRCELSQVQASEAPAAAAGKRLPILVVYKTLAYVTGVGLIILVFVGLPLQFWGHDPKVADIVGILHGFLYIGYVIVALFMSLQARFHPVKAVLVAAAGTVPFCAFIAEHYIAKDAEAAILRNRAMAKARRERRLAAAARTAGGAGTQRVPRQAGATEAPVTETAPSAE